MDIFMNVKCVALFMLRTIVTALVLLGCFEFLILADHPMVLWKLFVGWSIVFWMIDISNWMRQREREIFDRDKKLKEMCRPVYKFDTRLKYIEFTKKHPDYIAKAVCRCCNAECGVPDIEKSDIFFKCDACSLREFDEYRVEGRLP